MAVVAAVSPPASFVFTGAVPRTKTGCQACRARHLKCDEEKPCSRCVKTGIECNKSPNIRFRHGANPSVNIAGGPRCEYDFAADQTWIRPTKRLNFIDETKELVTGYDKNESTQVHLNCESQDIQRSHLADNVTNPGNDQDEQTDGVSNLFDSPSITMAAKMLQSLSGQPSPAAISIASTYGGSPSSAPDYLDSTLARQHDLVMASPSSSRSLDGQKSSARKRKALDTPPFEYPQYGPRSTEAIVYSPSSTTSPPILGYDPTATNDLLLDLNEVPSVRHNSTLSAGTNTSYISAPQLSAPDVDETFSEVSKTLSKIYLDSPVWPLSHDEAILMRHYVDSIAGSFDMCDPFRHFSTVVPYRAAICPTLLNAILAASACHLARTTDYDVNIMHRYHQKCLDHLIPMLGDIDAIMDENLLAATVILRYMEEIEVPICGTDAQNHLLGSHVFISAQVTSGIQDGLRQAAYWVALRQEVHVAFVSQRTISSALQRAKIDHTVEPTDDFTWANRVIVHCANVIRFCFGDGERSIPHYNSLWDYGQQWMLYKPASYSPVYFKEPESPNVFQDVWLIGDHIACALQHWHLAQILLAAHNPKIPRLGPGQKTALEAMEREIKSSVLVISAIAQSNPRCPPNWVTACMAVALCGERFSLRHEQEALLGVLHTTETQHGWPTGMATRALREMWGWEEE